MLGHEQKVLSSIVFVESICYRMTFPAKAVDLTIINTSISSVDCPPAS